MAAFLGISDYWWSWGDLLFRWLHVIAGMAWIGASFYFIALDKHLRPPAEASDAARGVGGEAWEVHGGGFYRVEKFRAVPDPLPEPLYWFKWEAYTTWLSGFALLIVVSLRFAEPTDAAISAVAATATVARVIPASPIFLLLFTRSLRSRVLVQPKKPRQRKEASPRP